MFEPRVGKKVILEENLSKEDFLVSTEHVI